jgi:hypothetical protein
MQRESDVAGLSPPWYAATSGLELDRGEPVLFGSTVNRCLSIAASSALALSACSSTTNSPRASAPPGVVGQESSSIRLSTGVLGSTCSDVDVFGTQSEQELRKVALSLRFCRSGVQLTSYFGQLGNSGAEIVGQSPTSDGTAFVLLLTTPAFVIGYPSDYASRPLSGSASAAVFVDVNVQSSTGIVAICVDAGSCQLSDAAVVYEIVEVEQVEDA